MLARFATSPDLAGMIRPLVGCRSGSFQPKPEQLRGSVSGLPAMTIRNHMLV